MKKFAFNKKNIMILALGLLCLVFIILCYVNRDALKRELIFRRMNTRQKVAQTFMMDFSTWQGEAVSVLNDDLAQVISDYDLGGLILSGQNMKSSEDTFRLTCDMQAAAMEHHGVPLLIAADQEGGMVYRLGDGTAMCGNMALAATDDIQLSYDAGYLIGTELSAVGVNLNLAPVVDVNNNAANPVIGVRSFSDSQEIVTAYSKEYTRGLIDGGVITCAKHFPGHGNTETDSHYGLPVSNLTYEELLQNELKPYEHLIANGQDMIMTAHILFPEIDSSTVLSDKTGVEEYRPATMSYVMLTDILRNQMGFDGVICTDAMNMEGISNTFDEGQAVVLALSSGADLICMPVAGVNSTEDLARLDRVIDRVCLGIKKGELSKKRLNDAVRRILKLKQERGILDYSTDDLSEENLEIVGCKEHRELEREISAKAVTVVKNDGILPLSITPDSKTLVLTAYENELGQIAIGWNRAVKEQVISDRSKVDITCYSEDDFMEISSENSDDYGLSSRLTEMIDDHNHVIVLSEIGSSGKMDNKCWQSGIPYRVTAYAKSQGKDSIVMSVDKPYDVQLYPDADGIVCVYGCKGSTVDVTEVLLNVSTDTKKAFGPNIVAGMEVILGTYPAVGKLPIDIPLYDAETGSYTEKIVYERGFGLTYNSVGKNIYMSDGGQPQQEVEETKILLGDEQPENYLPLLEGKRVALFSNQTGIVGDRNTIYSAYQLSENDLLPEGYENIPFGQDEFGNSAVYGMHILDAFIEQGVNVQAIFSPEHGFRGTEDAGAGVNDSVDEKTGVPILSLYSGNSHYPSDEDMDRFDVLVVDIQDVGLRFYTYYISMYYLIDACGAKGKEVVILDRPNPNGFYVDGPVLKEGFHSGVGRLPIPVVHGMTLGELALMMNGEGWLEAGKDSCNITVIPCENYNREDHYSIVKRPSPNIKDMRAVYLYASTCFFENTVVSVGRGTELPFNVYGSPYYNQIEGYDYTFVPQSIPGANQPMYEGQTCYGVNLTNIPLDVLWDEGINLQYVIRTYQDMAKTNPQVNFWGKKDKNGHYWIDLLMGTDSVRVMIEQGCDAQTVKSSWKQEVDAFKKSREKYLIYQ